MSCTRRLLCILLPLLPLLSSCTGGGKRNLLQSAAAEAVFRKVYADCPRRADAKILVIAIGESSIDPARAEFEDRFSDLPIIPYERVKFGNASGVLQRVYDPVTGQTPLQIHLKSLEPAPGKTDEFIAVGSWAFKEEVASAKYLIVKKGAGFEVTKIEDIPVPPLEKK